MLDLKTKADLQRHVDEGIEESLILDYKASPALTRTGSAPGKALIEFLASPAARAELVKSGLDPIAH